jgi:hypothetical protein
MTRGEPPCALDEDADAEAEAVAIRERLDATLPGRDVLGTILLNANVGVVGAGGARGVQRTESEVLDCRIAEGGSRRECRCGSRRRGRR